MRKLQYLLTMIIMVLTTSAVSGGALQNDTLSDDSTVCVVAWFSKNDSVTYRVTDLHWKISGNDTILVASMKMRVLLTVTDANENGYRMKYRFLEFQGDSSATSALGKFQNQLTVKLGNKIKETEIDFETDEYGEIKKYHNLGKIKKQAKALFEEGMKEVMSFPEIQELKALGMDMSALVKDVDTDQLIDGYLEELNLIFNRHGYVYPIGERAQHFDATDTEYEHDTYEYVGQDADDGSYWITNEVVNVIPRGDIKSRMD